MMNNMFIQPLGILPAWLALSVTKVCDAKCTICNIWKSTDHKMMDPNDLQHSLANEFFNGIQNVAFFGGEPTRNNKLPELVNVIIDRFPWAEVSIVTNGIDETRIKNILKIISEKVTKELLVCVSINGTLPRHEQIKGIDGAYTNALKVLEYAKTFFKKRPRISLTLLPDFTDEIAHIGWLAQKFEADIGLRCAVSGSYFKGTIDMTWTETQIKYLREEIGKIPGDLLANLRFCESLPRFLESGLHKDCVAHRKALIVDPDLGTAICHNRPTMCHLKDIPEFWGKAKEWYKAGAEDCFKGQECFIDGPYSLSYI